MTRKPAIFVCFWPCLVTKQPQLDVPTQDQLLASGVGGIAFNERIRIIQNTTLSRYAFFEETTACRITPDARK